MRCKKSGSFIRKSDNRLIQRFLCVKCRKSFSTATFEPAYRQHKRHFNPTIFSLLCGGFSQRRCALHLGINRKTVVRKFVFLGLCALEYLADLNGKYPKASAVQFDDMETYEHTKWKPLAITIAVVEKERRILGFEVSPMRPKRKMTEKAFEKYGPPQEERKQGRNRLFTYIKEFMAESGTIYSDKEPRYCSDVKRHFPKYEHKRTKSQRGCVVGQGELKGGGWDPLFSLNHTCAMLRDNIKRLARRTWCTTKKAERLRLHIAIYALYHNEFLLKH